MQHYNTATLKSCRFKVCILEIQLRDHPVTSILTRLRKFALPFLSSAFICIWMEVNRMKSVLWPAVNRGTHLLIKQIKFYIWPNVTGLFNIILKRQHVNHQTMWVLINDISHIYKTWWEPACYCFSAVTDTQLLSAYIENLRTVNVGRIT